MPTTEEIIHIGFSLHQEGKLDEAEDAYSEALKMDSENAEVCNLIGVLKLQKGETDEAIKYVERAIEKSPQAYFYETLFPILLVVLLVMRLCFQYYMVRKYNRSIKEN